MFRPVVSFVRFHCSIASSSRLYIEVSCGLISVMADSKERQFQFACGFQLSVAANPKSTSLIHCMIAMIDRTPQSCPLVCWDTWMRSAGLLLLSFLTYFGPLVPQWTPSSMVCVTHLRNTSLIALHAVLTSWLNFESRPTSEVLKLYPHEPTSSLFDFFTISTMHHPQWLLEVSSTNPSLIREIILKFIRLLQNSSFSVLLLSGRPMF